MFFCLFPLDWHMRQNVNFGPCIHVPTYTHTELAPTESPFQLALRADFYQGFGKQVGTMTNMLSHQFNVCMGLIENMGHIRIYEYMKFTCSACMYEVASHISPDSLCKILLDKILNLSYQ